VADEELLVGVVVDVVDCEDEEDASPDSPVVPVVPPEELGVLADVDEADVESADDRTAPAPEWSWATTTPMTTVAPAAAIIVPRVSVRSRHRALSRSAGVLGWADSAMCMMLLGRIIPSEHARFDTDAEPAVVLL
jgi:hypothetical protein